MSNKFANLGDCLKISKSANSNNPQKTKCLLHLFDVAFKCQVSKDNWKTFVKNSYLIFHQNPASFNLELQVCCGRTMD